MSIYTSLSISREKALEIVHKAMRRDDDLQRLVNVVLEKYTTRNVYKLVERGEPNQDDDMGLTYLDDWQANP